MVCNRIVCPPLETLALHAAEGADRAGRVAIELGELLSIVQAALQQRRAWVADFADERVEISRDLHEVLQAAAALGPS